MVVAGLALLGAALGEAVARLPADACNRLVRGAAPQHLVRQLLIGWARSVVVLGTGTAMVVTALVLAEPAQSWTPAATAVGVALLPLVAAPVTVAPLLGAPLRLALLGWCVVRVVQGLGATPAVLAATLAGALTAAGVGRVLGGSPPGDEAYRIVRDTVAVLVASPIMLAAGVVPLLVGLPPAPGELWRYCLRPDGRRPLEPSKRPDREPGPTELFVVYLDGVGKTRRVPTRVADGLATAMGEALPGARFVTDVLPYSPHQLPLTERPGASGRIWRALRRRAFPFLVGHNILQTLVVLDARYQQAYGQAVGTATAAALRRAGHRPGDRVALLGYSGGAAIAVAAADPLTGLLGQPPVVVSLGGFLDGHRMPQQAQVHHLASSADRLERLGRVMFMPRWTVARRSAWNRALAAGAVRRHPMSGPRHVGTRGYLATMTAADGSSNVARTAAVTARLLHSGLRR